MTLLASTTIPWVLAYVPWVHPRVGMGTARMKTFEQWVRDTIILFCKGADYQVVGIGLSLERIELHMKLWHLLSPYLEL